MTGSEFNYSAFLGATADGPRTDRLPTVVRSEESGQSPSLADGSICPGAVVRHRSRCYGAQATRGAESMGLDHAVLWVENAKRALKLYVDVLGLEPVRADNFAEGKARFPSARINETTIFDLMEPSEK